MSNPNDVPQPQQPGAQHPDSSNVPPAGYQPPQGNQPPQGYPQQAPGYQQPSPAYQQPARQAGQGGFQFEMPADRPHGINDVLPKGGFSGMFNVNGLPIELKVSYWIWLIGGLLGLLFGVIGLFGTMVLFSFAPGIAAVVLLLVILAIVLAAAQVVLAMRMKEGKEWARLALTIVAGISLVLAILNAASAGGQGGGSWFGFVIAAVATVLMWLPNSQMWFKSVRGATA